MKTRMTKYIIAKPLKWEDKQTFNSCRTSEFNKQKINIGLSKILRKFVAKLLKYRILFKDILKFLGLDYWEASLIILYSVVLGLCGNDERVASHTLKSYLTVIGIILVLKF